MKTININGSMRREIKVRSERIERKKKHVERKKSEGAEYMRSSHQYVLIIGDEETNEKKEMYGREAKAVNHLFLLRFGSGKEKRLKKWKWLKSSEAAHTKVPNG